MSACINISVHFASFLNLHHIYEKEKELHEIELNTEVSEGQTPWFGDAVGTL